MKNPFRKQYSNERARHLRALWDYWLCGCNLQKVVDKYKNDETAPSCSYQTLNRWKDKFHFDDRVLAYQESLIEQDRIIFEEARQVWIMEQLDLLELHNAKIEVAEVDTEMVSLNQFTNAVNTQIKMIQSVFNIEPVSKIAPTDPSGKKEYQQGDIAELLKLADAAKRRPR